MKYLSLFFICCLLLAGYTAHADVWGNRELGDILMASLATILMLVYTALLLMILFVAGLERKKARPKALIVYNGISFFLYLLFFCWLVSFFHSYPKSFGRILIEGTSRGTVHLGWMIIVSFTGMLISLKVFASDMRRALKEDDGK